METSCLKNENIYEALENPILDTYVYKSKEIVNNDNQKKNKNGKACQII